MSELQDAVHKIKIAQLQQAVMEKVALWQKFKEGLMAAGTAAAVAGAGVAAQKGFVAIRDRIVKPRAFKDMIGASPGLKKMDQKAVQMTFNSLYAMNPAMAKDPLISGSFVERHVQGAEGMSAGSFIDPRSATMIQGREEESPIMRAFTSTGSTAIGKKYEQSLKPPIPEHRPGTSSDEYGRTARMETFKSKLRDRKEGGRYPTQPKY